MYRNLTFMCILFQSVQKALQKELFTLMSNQPVACLPQNHSSPLGLSISDESAI